MTQDLIKTREFEMSGAREILKRAGKALQIGQQISAIEKAIDTMPASVFDSAKALIETVCKTILGELGIHHDKSTNMLKLFGQTLEHLHLS